MTDMRTENMELCFATLNQTDRTVLAAKRELESLLEYADSRSQALQKAYIREESLQKELKLHARDHQAMQALRDGKVDSVTLARLCPMVDQDGWGAKTGTDTLFAKTPESAIDRCVVAYDRNAARKSKEEKPRWLAAFMPGTFMGHYIGPGGEWDLYALRSGGKLFGTGVRAVTTINSLPSFFAEGSSDVTDDSAVFESIRRARERGL